MSHSFTAADVETNKLFIELVYRQAYALLNPRKKNHSHDDTTEVAGVVDMFFDWYLAAVKRGEIGVYSDEVYAASIEAVKKGKGVSW